MPRSEQEKDTRREYEAKNRDKINSTARAWRHSFTPEKHIEQLALARKYHNDHKEHINTAKQLRYKTDPEYREHKRLSNIQWLYGLSKEEYISLCERQNNICASCGKPNSTGKRERLNVDHDHTTGEIRGLLCNKCNTALGLLDEDPNLIMSLLQYLRNCERFVPEDKKPVNLNAYV